LALKAVFLDRDGILNHDREDYVKTPEEFEVLPGLGEPLRRIREKEFLIVIVTNQSAIGKGLITHELLGEIHDKMRAELQRQGGSVDAIYYCPHTPEEGCDCRKPMPGLILRAAREMGIDLKESWLIGDKASDIEAARRAGCKAIRVPANDDGLEIGVRQILGFEGN
jgi:histidinol-phosphate phosphatase family protein